MKAFPRASLGALAVSFLLAAQALAQQPVVPRPGRPGVVVPTVPPLFPQPTQPTTPQPVRPAAPVDMSTFDRNFADFIQRATKTVSPGRRIHQWHWVIKSVATAGKDPRLSLRDQVLQHVGFLKGTFDRAEGFGMAGPGFYTAGDPNTSSGFGQLHGGPVIPLPQAPGVLPAMDWVLVQTVLRENVKFLDAVQFPTFPEPLKTQITQKGCTDGFFSVPSPGFPVQGPAGMQELFRSAASQDFGDIPGQPKPPITPAQEVCRDLRKKALEISGAQAMRFNFSSNPVEGCPARRKEQIPGFENRALPANAFVMWGNDAINMGEMVVFSKELPPAGDIHQTNRLMIQDLFNRTGNPLGPWPELWGMRPLNVDMLRFVRTSIMGCIPRGMQGFFPEDDF
ncbi:MAG TPA: hypothetical protein VM598_03915 [Bdellovibrionota bacterium]|nr:hypothetical protein [Bdellovibrionota bacterium]